MAYEAEILTQVNNRLKSKLNTKPFQKGEFYLIAELVERENSKGEVQTIPAIVDNYGECIYVGIEDKYPYQSYFRIDKFTQSYTNDNTFGNDSPWVKQSSDIIFVVIADRAKCELTREQLVTIVSSSFPQDIDKATLQTIGGNSLLSADLLDMNINIDKMQVYDRECENTSVSLPPNIVMFSVEFTLEIVINPACLTAC